jgi:uncharacterized protein YlaN (UPF0358 family)
VKRNSVYRKGQSNWFAADWFAHLDGQVKIFSSDIDFDVRADLFEDSLSYQVDMMLEQQLKSLHANDL